MPDELMVDEWNKKKEPLTEVNASEEVPDELVVDEWHRRKEPSTFDCSLSVFSNQINHNAQLQKMPLLPGSVVSQVLYPSSTSLLQLLMMNKMIQFYRLNKYEKELILSKLLSTNSHPGYQATVKQLFNYLTINQKYSMYCSHETHVRQFSIHLGAVNTEFLGCFLTSVHYSDVKIIGNKATVYFGTR